MNNFPIYGGLTAKRFYPLPAYTEAGGWQIKARLIGGDAAVEIPAEYFTADGSTWALSWPKEETAGLPAGNHTLLIIAFDGAGSEIPAIQEAVRVIAADATDLRSETKRTLDALNATLEKKATRDELSRSYNGRSIGRMGWEELLKAKGVLERRFKAEQNAAAGKKKIQTVNYRFV